MTQRLLDSLMSTDALAAAFSDRAVLAGMLDFEVALARVEARLDLIPARAADAIAAAADPDLFDVAAIARDARASATMPMPLVDMLRARVEAIDPAAATFVHWGATSQDVVDTAVVGCVGRARAILADDHARLTRTLRDVSERHAGTAMLARTLLQPAPPTTFGLKAAGWFAAVSRSGAWLWRAFDEAAVLQFGGASGTLAALGARGSAVATELARELRLANPAAPWHAHRDRFAWLVAACGVYGAALAKLARDVALLMQAEVGEAAERGGGSSTMPHKRNPAGCAAVLAAWARVPGLVAAFLAAPQEHERGIGGWQAEASTVACVIQATGAALAAAVGVVEGLSVDPDRMRANIDQTKGLVFAERAMVLLAPLMGRRAAIAAIDAAIEAARTGAHDFAGALAANGDVRRAIGSMDLSTLAQPDEYLGSAEEFRRRLIDRE